MEVPRKFSPVCCAWSRLWFRVAIVVGGCLLPIMAVAAEPGRGEEGAAGAWITLGLDAFETLSQRNELAFESAPLRSVAQRSDVVVTQVHARDLDRISAILHEVHRRCGGFMLHPSLQQAMRALDRASSESRGVGIDYTIDQHALVASLETELQRSEILSTIQHLSTVYNNRYHAHPSGLDAANWIRDLWQGYATGRPEVTVDLRSHSGTSQPSVILTIPGTTLGSEVVVLGGHMDSIAFGTSNPNFRAPGADDNASGIAVLSEVIRVAMAEGFRPQRTVQFMAYAAEEIGLVGSQEIADSYSASGANVVAVLQLDMTDYKGSTADMAFLDDYTNTELTAFAADLVDTFQPELSWTMTTCGYGCSDHASWHREGFPAVMPSEARFGQHNPNIHTTGDTLAFLGNNVEHAYKFARLATALMVEIGVDFSEPPLFGDGFESGSTAAWSLTVPGS